MESNILLSKYFLIQIYFIIFSFILFSNLIGLIPFSFTLTSSFILTFSIALITLIIINILAIYRHGFYQFSNFFLPNGTPLGIAFLLVFIEFISYIARLFSLSIRLFANMMSGHTLLKILIGFCFTILFSISVFSSFAALPWILILGIMILEILIAFLQAYVFLILICIYCNDILFVH
jgi:ATP synthase subunit 6